MKILAISSHHPPYHFGGYELRIRDILDGLVEHGHTIRVLTNKPERKPSNGYKSAYPIVRKLHNRRRARFFPLELLYDLLDTGLLAREIKHFKPDVIYLGHTYILSKTILPYLTRQTLPIVYDEGGAGLVEAWTEHGRWFHFTGDYSTGIPLLDALKKPIIWLVGVLSMGRLKPQWQWPQNMQIIFNSELNRSVAVKAGVPLERSTVIHSGVDTNLFTFKPRIEPGTPLRIITPGRIERRKGQKDAVELLDHLLKAGVDAHLVLAGPRWTDGYYEEVIGLIDELKLVDKVEILPILSSTELIKQYHQADICLFPSYQQVGFSRVPLEAMACGCLVITYGNEGSDELVNNDNGITIISNKYTEITSAIDKLINNPGKYQKIVNTAWQDINCNYSMSKYILKIQDIIESMIMDKYMSASGDKFES